MEHSILSALINDAYEKNNLLRDEEYSSAVREAIDLLDKGFISSYMQKTTIRQEYTLLLSHYDLTHNLEMLLLFTAPTQIDPTKTRIRPVGSGTLGKPVAQKDSR